MGRNSIWMGICSVLEAQGECPTAGWRCRWLNSHTRTLGNGEIELVVDEQKKRKYLESLQANPKGDEPNAVGGATLGILNAVGMKHKIILHKTNFNLLSANLDRVETQKIEAS